MKRINQNKKLQTLFIIAPILGVLHMLEQWFFGLSQAFGDVKMLFNNLTTFFETIDKAIVFLVTVFVFLWLMTTYLLLRGGKWQPIVVIFFSIIFISEIHHPLRAFLTMSYYPGSITGLIFFFLGIMLLKESIKIIRGDKKRHYSSS